MVPLVSNSKFYIRVCCVSCFPLSEKKGSKTSWLWTLPSRSKRAEILESGMQFFFLLTSLSNALRFYLASIISIMFVAHSGFLQLLLITEIRFNCFAEIIFYL